MRLFCGLAALLVLSGCFAEEKWTAFVYPNAYDLSVHSEYGPYNSFEKCQAVAIGTLRSQGKARTGSYECGLNCEYKPEWQASMCKETRK